jgi:hypothetical protein
LFAWLTLLPVIGPLPHTLHTRAIRVFLPKNWDRRLPRESVTIIA